MNKSKLLGQTFTESSEVINMLNMYKGTLLKSKVMEPSYGSGHFLEFILRQMIKEGRDKKYSENKIAKLIEENLHGYELDEIFHKQCLRNLKAVLKNLNFKENLQFKNLINKTSFDKNNKNKYDLIIGNPPYVRVQNFDNGTKHIQKYLSRTSGNTDLYLMFIDFYLNKLSKYGQFIFIVPNSLGKSKSAKKIRDWMFKNGKVQYFDFEAQQLFPTASVYSCVFNFEKNSKEISEFYTPIINKNWFKNKKILFNNENYQPKIKNVIKRDLNVKNGIATLSDSLFIFNKKPNLENIYRIYKASRLKDIKYVLFPYKLIKGEVVRFKDSDEMKKFMPKAYEYLYKNKGKLINRSLEKSGRWYEFGRSQAIKDIGKIKYVINTLIKPNQKELEILKIPKNTLVYSGLYSTTDAILEINNLDLIKSLRFKAKDMRGGYKKISSSLLKYEK